MLLPNTMQQHYEGWLWFLLVKVARCYQKRKGQNLYTAEHTAVCLKMMSQPLLQLASTLHPQVASHILS